MAEITSVHYWYPDGYPGTYYDLREVVSWSDGSEAGTVQVRFSSNWLSPVVLDKDDFEAAKAASLAAGG